MTPDPITEDILKVVEEAKTRWHNLEAGQTGNMVEMITAEIVKYINANFERNKNGIFHARGDSPFRINVNENIICL